jgi:cellulose synthase/poly-beta-1,6-N-acetylglucosamine synthase-like glycosyltransferase
MKTLVSVVIPVKEIDDYLRQETLPAILRQIGIDLEIIIVTDQESKERFPKTKIFPSWPKTGPADKRDLGVKRAIGEIIAFLDDDSYPKKDWLKNALRIFSQDSQIAGVCGPTLTPPHNNLRQKASGWVWASWLGSGGAGVYRCSPASRREVDDFPSVNLLVRKKDFWAVGGFDSQFWPGEDTKLCHDLVYKLGKKIIYYPSVLVYHHRQEVFLPHLRQISRYALHRGYFARILPQTSRRWGYFLPSLFFLGFIIGPFLAFINPILKFFYFGSMGIYLLALIFTALQVYFKEKDLVLTLLVMPSILITHLVYGALFIKGFLTPNLKSKYK